MTPLQDQIAASVAANEADWRDCVVVRFDQLEAAKTAAWQSRDFGAFMNAQDDLVEYAYRHNLMDEGYVNYDRVDELRGL